MEIGAFLQIYKNPVATYVALEHFRKAYPTGTIVILSDNGYNYTVMARHFNAIYIHSDENLGVSVGGKHPQASYNAMMRVVERTLEAIAHIRESHFLMLEPDVLVLKRYQEPFLGTINGNFVNVVRRESFAVMPFLNHIREDKPYTGHGGSVYNTAQIREVLSDTHMLTQLINYWDIMKLGPVIDSDIFFSLCCYYKHMPLHRLMTHSEMGERKDIAVLHQFKQFYSTQPDTKLRRLYSETTTGYMRLCDYLAHGALSGDDLIRRETYEKFIASYKHSKYVRCDARRDMTETLTGMRDTIVLSSNGDTDFPFPKAPYYYEYTPGYSDALLPTNLAERDYYKKINMDVLRVLERNNLYCVVHAASVHHPRVLMMPLGVYIKFNHLHLLQNKKETLCYMNFGIGRDRWCGNARREIVDYVRGKDFIVAENCVEHAVRNVENVDLFYERISKSKFAICPRGCGIDTYRLWDCIMLGCIPIVEKYQSHAAFADLPILFLDSVEDYKTLTADFLNSAYETMLRRSYNYDKLKMSYWLSTIRGLVDFV